MSFVSLEFVGFFAAVIVGLALVPGQAPRQAFLLLMSIAFYALGTPWFWVVLAVPSVVDYACALGIEAASNDRARRSWLTFSLVTNLGILFYFKYSNFFVDSVAGLFRLAPQKLYVVLPVGISFFTFKTMSYTIDVYRRAIPACRSLWRYALFVSFFPELVAGPIVRASVFLPQLDRPVRLSWTRTKRGAQMILLGLTKKLAVADRLAVLVDPVFGNPGAFSAGTVASAVIGYSIQIYCDFSGYTDMAIGFAMIIGFDLPENFNLPYLATSITEFWRRWHITLSEWLRDYLYIPLGGNRRGRGRTYVNLLTTMLLGGLWHGASWGFVAWGAWHGLGLAVHKAWRGTRARSEVQPSRLASMVGWLLTYLFVCAGWILFRAPSLGAAWLMVRKIIGDAPGGVIWFFLPLVIVCGLVVAGHAIGARSPSSRDIDLALPSLAGGKTTAAIEFLPRSAFLGSLVFTVWIVLLFLFAPLHHSPFIYFRF